jgi:hypothetical protein
MAGACSVSGSPHGAAVLGAQKCHVGSAKMKVERVGVVGCGQMGHGIVQVTAQAG